MSKERLEELLEYLLHQKELHIKWKEEEEIKKQISERHKDESGARCHQYLINCRNSEIEKLNDLIDLVQEAHFKCC